MLWWFSGPFYGAIWNSRLRLSSNEQWPKFGSKLFETVFTFFREKTLRPLHIISKLLANQNPKARPSSHTFIVHCQTPTQLGSVRTAFDLCIQLLCTLPYEKDPFSLVLSRQPPVPTTFVTSTPLPTDVKLETAQKALHYRLLPCLSEMWHKADKQMKPFYSATNRTTTFKCGSRRLLCGPTLFRYLPTTVNFRHR